MTDDPTLTGKPLADHLAGTVRIARSVFGVDMLEMYPDDTELANELIRRAEEFHNVSPSELAAAIAILRTSPETTH